MTKEERKAYDKAYYLSHKEKHQKYCQSHKERHNEVCRKWNKMHATQKRSTWNYCAEDLSKIENYNEAIKDNLRGWQIHHKLETRGFGYTKKELIALGLYYNRPAEELVFLKQSEHLKLHRSFNPVCILEESLCND
jgi:predicted Fe-S protein YdhL (DUF1289 family)